MKAIKIDTDENHPETTPTTFDNLKNRKKVTLLQGIDLTKYDEKMIRLLLDGDYKGELNNYRNKVMMLVHEIIDKKIPHTKFGVNTILYKLVRDTKNDRNASANIKERKPQPKKVDEHKKEEQVSENESTDSENDGDMVEVDEKTFTREVLKMAKTNKKMAIDVLKYNLKPTDELYEKLIKKLEKI